MPYYSLCSIIGVVAAVWVAKKMAVPKPPQHTDIMISAIIGLLIGAKIPIWLSYGFSGYLIYGKSFLGGLLGAFLAINFYKLITRQSGNSFGDRLVIPLAVAVGFGKIGCWLNGCCAGKELNLWGIEKYPVQLLESFFQFAMAFLLWRLYQKPQYRSLLFPFNALGYLTMRFFIEYWRVEPVIWGNMTVYQLLSLIFIPVFLTICWQRIKNVKQSVA